MKDLSVDMQNPICPLISFMYNCECQDNFIKYFDKEVTTGNEIVCEKCNSVFDDCPNSRLAEVIDFFNKEIKILNGLIDNCQHQCFGLSDLRYKAWIERQLSNFKNQLELERFSCFDKKGEEIRPESLTAIDKYLDMIGD